MFFPHFATINLERKEPKRLKSDRVAKIESAIRKRNEEVAIRIVNQASMNGDNKQSPVKLAKKIKTKRKFLQGQEELQDFMEIWNRWRYFYFALSPIVPRTSSQITQIKNAIAFADVQNIKMNMMVACLHKEFVWRKFNPNFYHLERDGLDFYQKHYDEVLQDVEQDSYRQRSAL